MTGQGSGIRDARVEPEQGSDLGPALGLDPRGGKLCRGVWLPEAETHLVGMIEKHSKTGDVDGRGTYQLDKLRRAMEFVPQDRRRVALDIGAHVGLWSMHLAGLFGHVFAFEPIPLHRRLYRANMAGADNWTLYERALGDKFGSLCLTNGADSSGDTHVATAFDPAGNVAMVDTLDSYGIEDADFIKIDCEGYERHIVAGGLETIKRCRPAMIVEQKGHAQRYYGEDPLGAVRLLESIGMRIVDKISGDYILTFT